MEIKFKADQLFTYDTSVITYAMLLFSCVILLYAHIFL